MNYKRKTFYAKKAEMLNLFKENSQLFVLVFSFLDSHGTEA